MSPLKFFKKDFQFMFCGGKGGVGKTIVSAAIGLWTAKQGKKTLVFSTDPAHSLSDVFDVKIGNKLTRIDGENNLYALEINSEEVLKNYKKRYEDAIENILNRGQGRGIDLPFERQLLHDATDLSPPGLDELMALSKLNDMLTDYKFDYIVIDTAAGAHTIRLIELPQIIDEWMVSILRLLNKYSEIVNADEVRLLLLEQRVDMKRLRETILNPKRAVFVAVTIPEALGISVTKRMINDFKSFGISCGKIIVNFVIPSNIKCSYCALKRQEQMEKVEEIHEKFQEYDTIEMPLFPHQIIGMESLNNFAKILFEGGCKPKISSLKVETSRTILPQIAGTPRLELQERNLVLFGGKGGCGKTTCSAATGIYMATHGKKTLVLSIDPQHSLPDSFDQEISEEATPIKGVDNLYAMEIDAEKLLKEWREENKGVLIEIAEDAAYLERTDISDFLDLSLPGMDELMAQRKLQQLLKKHEYDLYILDTAPTGHTIRFLELPDMMLRWVKILMQTRQKTRYVLEAFFGRRARYIKKKPDVFLQQTMDDASAIKAVLRSRRTELVPVTILEEIVTKESERLLKALRSNKMQVRQIVCNRINPKNPDCPYCTSRREMQQKELESVREKFSRHKIVEMPLFPHEIRGVEDLSKFAKFLFEEDKQV